MERRRITLLVGLFITLWACCLVPRTAVNTCPHLFEKLSVSSPLDAGSLLQKTSKYRLWFVHAANRGATLVLWFEARANVICLWILVGLLSIDNVIVN